MLSFYLPLCIICTIRLLRQAKDESQYDDQPNQVLSNSGDELQLKSENSEESFHENGGVVPSHTMHMMLFRVNILDLTLLNNSLIKIG